MIILAQLVILMAFSMPECISRRQHIKQPRRPNVIFIMTDDQDIALGSMEFMPKTLRMLRHKGVEFLNGFVTTPICCPSRSSILTGLYVHNHHVLTNNENCTGEQWRSLHEHRTFGAYLQKSGYRTGYFGKYLNEYDGSYIPPGWHEWSGLIKNSRFYNYTLNFNGQHIKHGFNYEKDYFTDLIANDTIAFIHRQRRLHRNKPILAVLSFPAPHGPEDPAPKYSHLFDDVKTHRTEAWNYAPNPDKQWLLQHTGKMEPVHVVFTDMLHRRRLQTLQSVDDNIQRVLNELRDLRELSNTYIIYTSDHGYHLGQFGLIKGKNMPYEFDLKVPFLYAVPEELHGESSGISEPVANIDLTPTVLDIANLGIPDFMDGRSLIPLIQHYDLPAEDFNWRHTLLVERGKMPKLKKIRDRVLKQRDRFGKEARIQTECSKDMYQPPCTDNQKWECRKNDFGQYRIFKCRALVEMDKQCVCPRSSNRKRKASRRRRKRKRRTLGGIFASTDSFEIKRVDTWRHFSMDFGEIPLSDEQEQAWAHEFLLNAHEKTIGRSNEWHQGDFGHHVDDGNFVFRTKRDTAIINSAQCTGNSSSIHERKNCNRKTNGVRKLKIKGKITNLRKRLSVFKKIQKALRRKEKMSKLDSALMDIPNDMKAKKCSCSNPVFHPLIDGSHDGAMDISVADLMAYQLERRQRRRNKKRRGNGKRNRPKFGTKKCVWEYDSSLWWVSSVRLLDPFLCVNTGLYRYRKDSKDNCNVAQMNCFTHNPQHWRTPPLWPRAFGDFCFCQNSNNNTYWCLRTVNATHNFLFCEFVTEFVSFYDLNADPHQLMTAGYASAFVVEFIFLFFDTVTHVVLEFGGASTDLSHCQIPKIRKLTNAVYTLPLWMLEQLSKQLSKLKNCKGSNQCEIYGRSDYLDENFDPTATSGLTNGVAFR